jgi:hypothetical protein
MAFAFSVVDLLDEHLVGLVLDHITRGDALCTAATCRAFRDALFPCGMHPLPAAPRRPNSPGFDPSSEESSGESSGVPPQPERACKCERCAAAQEAVASNRFRVGTTIGDGISAQTLAEFQEWGGCGVKQPTMASYVNHVRTILMRPQGHPFGSYGGCLRTPQMTLRQAYEQLKRSPQCDPGGFAAAALRKFMAFCALSWGPGGAAAKMSPPAAGDTGSSSSRIHRDSDVPVESLCNAVRLLAHVSIESMVQQALPPRPARAGVPVGGSTRSRSNSGRPRRPWPSSGRPKHCGTTKVAAAMAGGNRNVGDELLRRASHWVWMTEQRMDGTGT